MEVLWVDVDRPGRSTWVHPGSPWVTPRRGEGVFACSGPDSRIALAVIGVAPAASGAATQAKGRGLSSTGSHPTNDRDAWRLAHRGYPKM
jgi:hypothetical protein